MTKRRVILGLVFAAALTPGSGSAQTPEQRYADWAPPTFPASEYQARRAGILAALAREGGGVFLIPSADGVTSGATFPQLDDFLYLTGLELPGSLLALDADAAADATAEAIRVTARAVAPGVTEATLQGVFEGACRAQGALQIPFTPIIKSGPNSLWPWRILAAHVDRRNRAMEAGELVIQDVGCAVDGYVSDVGRTFPVDGTFNALQRQKLEMATRVSDAVIAAVRPGVTFAELTRVAYEAIPDEEERYMQTPSYFGHHLGLSAGDPSLAEEPLAPGMVFTIEPWYYNHDAGVSVFVEDVLLVTEDGVEVLTRGLPRSPDELERLMK